LTKAAGLDISHMWVGEGGGWLEGWLGWLLCLGGSERPCNTCNSLPRISFIFPQSFSLIHPHMRHRQPHTFQQAPPATSLMRDMLSHPKGCWQTNALGFGQRSSQADMWQGHHLRANAGQVLPLLTWLPPLLQQLLPLLLALIAARAARLVGRCPACRFCALSQAVVYCIRDITELRHP